jgi:phospholipid/cholesterol/gamma-HCH transport system permease protein
MRANREIEALESLGINPLSFIVFPRMVGGVISVLCLAFYFILIAIVGGFVITQFIHNIPFSFYSESVLRAFAKEDVLIFLLKNSFSGMIIFVVSCYQGLSVKKSPHEVPQVTTQAVVKSIIYVTVFNMSVTALVYLNQLKKIGVI